MPDAIACPGCLKRFKWTPKLAGRRVQCHCGQKFVAPEAAGGPVVPVYETGSRAPEPVAPGQQTYDLDVEDDADAGPVRQAPLAHADKCPDCNAPVSPEAVVCVRCGFNLAAGEKLQTAVGFAEAAEARDAPSAFIDGGPSFASYGASPAARALAERSDEVQPSVFRERVAPALLLGVAAVWLPALSLWGTASWGEAGWHLLLNAGIAALSTLAVLGALLIAAGPLGIALGTFRGALVKCLAIGLAGSFIADTLTVLAIPNALLAGIHGIVGIVCIAITLNVVLVGLPLLIVYELDFLETGLVLLLLMLLKFAGFFIFFVLIQPA